MYTYDAVWALALGLAKSEREVDGWLQEDCGRNVNCHGVELVERIRGQTFQGASGKIKFNRVVSTLRYCCHLAHDIWPIVIAPRPPLSSDRDNLPPHHFSVAQETSEGVTVFNANRDGTGINFPVRICVTSARTTVFRSHVLSDPC